MRINALFCFLSGSIAKGATDDGFSALADWVVANGGRVDGRMTVRESNGIRGVFALSYIPAGTLLAFIPRNLIIDGNQSSDEQRKHCQIISRLETELWLGKKSFFSPYLDMDRSNVTLLPALMADSALSELHGLPPYSPRHHMKTYKSSCRAGKDYDMDSVELRSLIAVLSRVSDKGLVPVYDLLNHHNGKLNTEVRASKKGMEIMVIRPISEGNEIWNSYGEDRCPEFFRDYGFIPEWPQIWWWDGQRQSKRSRQRHTFSVIDHQLIKLYPTRHQRVSRGGSKAEVVDKVRAHNGALSREKINLFLVAAKQLLANCPSTLEEDQQILSRAKDTASGIVDRLQGHETKDDDLLRIVHYRMQFKRALRQAEAVAAATLHAYESHDQKHVREL